MLYVKFSPEGDVIGFSEEYPRDKDGKFPPYWENRWDWESFERAQYVAAALSDFAEELYLAIDSGPNVSPRYDVIKAPKIGEDVSRYFNGDAYPVGKIVKISKGHRIVYVENERGARMNFYRRKLSGAWLSGGWGLLPGIRNDRNPHF